MMCAVCGCNNHNSKNKKSLKENLSFFSFPKDPVLLQKWVDFCKRKDVFNTKTSRICSEHFTPNDIEKNMQFEMGFMNKKHIRLKPGTMPSVYNDTHEYISVPLPSKRVKRVETKCAIDPLLLSDSKLTASHSVEDRNEYIEKLSICEMGTEDYIQSIHCEGCDSLQNQIEEQNKEIEELREANMWLIQDTQSLQNKIKSYQSQLAQIRLKNKELERKIVQNSGAKRKKMRKNKCT